MNLKKELLNLLEFSDISNFDDRVEYSDSDTQGISISDKTIIGGKYIDYYVYRKKEKVESWKSIDIYIKTEKKEIVLTLLFNFLIQKGILVRDNIKEFHQIENNDCIFIYDFDDNKRLDITKTENQLVVLITKFNYK